MKIVVVEAWSRSAWSVPGYSRKLCSLLMLLVLTAACHATAHANSSLSGQIAGTVTDQAGATVVGARVVLFGMVGVEAQRSLTDQQGRFSLGSVIASDYVVCVQKSGFREVRRVLHVAPGENLQLQFQLNVASIFETVTVTPGRGQPQGLFDVPQSPAVITDVEIARHAATILPQALRDIPGVHIQQTTSGQGSALQVDT